MSDDIWRWSATRIATAIRGRDISAREALESCLGRMAAVNAKLNAVTVDLSKSAREAADRADAAVARGDELGALHGVPVTIKENVDQQGSATTNGVVGFQNIIALEDSPIVANWKKAGAVILGRTNTPAFSFQARYGERFARAHLQPVVENAHPWRLVGRRGVLGRRGHHAAGARQRHRRIGAISRVLLRPGGYPAVIRARARVQPDADRRAFPVVATHVGAGPSCTQRRRRASGSRRDGGPRSARPLVDAGAARRAGAFVATADPRRGRHRSARSCRRQAAAVGCPRARASCGVARRRRVRDRRRQNAGFHARQGALVRDADAGVSSFFAAADRKGRRRGNSHRGPFHVRQHSTARCLVVHEVAGGTHTIDPRMDPLFGSRAAGAGADLLGAGVPARLRHRKCRAYRGLVARVRDHDGGSGARSPGDGRADRRGRWAADGRADRGTALSRRLVSRRRRGDRSAREAC